MMPALPLTSLNQVVEQLCAIIRNKNAHVPSWRCKSFTLPKRQKTLSRAHLLHDASC